MEFVSILMGSKSDYSVMKTTAEILEKFGVQYELIVSSAHRTPERTKEYIKDAEKRGSKVFVAGAGLAAHLAGAIASMTTKPVIGIPLDAGSLGGQDALLSTVQMPGGMPVATVAIGKAGAKNAGYLAVQILALNNGELAEKLQEDRIMQIKKVENDSKEIEVFLK
jgi:5-(carboxyamino)imidazole ribonucleotide mutase